MIKMMKMYSVATMALVKKVDRFLIDQLLIDSETYMITPVSATEAIVEANGIKQKKSKNKKKSTKRVELKYKPSVKLTSGWSCKMISESNVANVTTELKDALCWLLDKEPPSAKKVLQKYYNDRLSYLVEDLGDDLAEEFLGATLRADIMDTTNKKKPVRLIAKDHKLTLLTLQKLAAHCTCWSTDDKEERELIASVMDKHVDKFKELNKAFARSMKSIEKAEKAEAASKAAKTKVEKVKTEKVKKADVATAK